EGIDFLPLTVDYREYTYASGRIPGGFFKREGKPAEKEVLTSRVIDRPIRPLFPSGWRHETQIIALVLSADQDNDTNVQRSPGARGRQQKSTGAEKRGRPRVLPRGRRKGAGPAHRGDANSRQDGELRPRRRSPRRARRVDPRRRSRAETRSQADLQRAQGKGS